MIMSHHSSLRRISVRCVRCSVSWHPKPCTDFKKTQLHHFYSTVVCYFVYWITIDHLLKILIFMWQQGRRVAELRNLLTPNIDIYNYNRTQAMYGPTSMQGISLCPKSHCSLCLLALKVLAAKQSMQCSFRSFWRCLSDCLITAVQSCLIMNISATELPNFIRKYYLLHKLLIFKYWWQNISVSNIALHTAVRHAQKRAQDWQKPTSYHSWCAQNSCWKKYPEHAVDFIWFTDEKVFTIASPTNLQNDMVYAASGTKKNQLPAERLSRTRSMFSQFSDGGSCCEHSGMFRSVLRWFRDKSQWPVLSRYFASSTATASHSWSVWRLLYFKQDNASAHRARETVYLLTHETPDFIPPALCPANSPDLNPVDYQIWWKLQECVYRSQIRDVDQLRSRLIEEWEHFHQVVIDEAVRPLVASTSSSLRSSTRWTFWTQDFRCAGVLPFARTHTWQSITNGL